MTLEEFINTQQKLTGVLTPEMAKGLEAGFKISSSIPDHLRSPVVNVSALAAAIAATSPTLMTFQTDSATSAFLSSAVQKFLPYAKMMRNQQYDDYGHYLRRVGLYNGTILSQSDLYSREIRLEGPNEVEEVIEETETKIDSTFVGADKIKILITDIYEDNALFNGIHPREFEEVIGELLRHQGYEVELTKQTRDNGYDIIALKTLAGNIPFKALVECKRTKNTVGVGIIRSFTDVVTSEGANLGILATTSFFSRDAVKKKNTRPYLLNFKDRVDILDWISDYIINPNTLINS